jgi:hypothetical protein
MSTVVGFEIFECDTSTEEALEGEDCGIAEDFIEDLTPSSQAVAS